MKKSTIATSVVSVALALGLAFSFASCKSSAPSQEVINESFGKVYKNYSGIVNLEGAQNYTVQSGDTLTAISKNFYGQENGYYFPLIMVASYEVVLDPDLITPGMELVIPDFDSNINDEEIAAKLSPYFRDVSNIYKLKDTEAAPVTRENLLKISDELAEKGKNAIQDAVNAQAEKAIDTASANVEEALDNAVETVEEAVEEVVE